MHTDEKRKIKDVWIPWRDGIRWRVTREWSFVFLYFLLYCLSHYRKDIRHLYKAFSLNQLDRTRIISIIYFTIESSFTRINDRCFYRNNNKLCHNQRTRYNIKLCKVTAGIAILQKIHVSSLLWQSFLRARYSSRNIFTCKNRTRIENILLIPLSYWQSVNWVLNR